MLWFYLGYDLFDKSLKLTELFEALCERVTRQVSKPSFAADVLEKKGFLTIVKSIRLLKKEEIVKNSREPFQWAKGIKPGDVTGIEVRLTPENDKIEVICT